MRFSVIIPVYKVEKYLSECVDSVLGQTYKDFELILVDDGSPDRCPEICDDYARKDARVKVMHQNAGLSCARNAGAACARNAGVACARGSYIIFLDSDDYFVGDTVLEKINEKTLLKPDVIVYGYKKYFESDGTYGDSVCSFPNNAEALAPSVFLRELLVRGSYSGTAWCKVIKSSILKDNNIEFRPGMISEDIDWYIQVMMCAKKYSTINESLYVYRLRPDSISHNAKLHSLTDNLWIKETWPQRIKDSGITADLKNVLMNIMGYYIGNFYVLYSGYDKAIRKEYYSRVKALSYLFDYSITSRSLVLAKVTRILGFKIMIALLRIAGKFKKRT